MSSIKQALAKVVFDNKSYWIRISRQKPFSLLNYWTNQYGFRYMKIYEFQGSGLPKFDAGRITGKQIGYIYFRKLTNSWEYVEMK